MSNNKSNMLIDHVFAKWFTENYTMNHHIGSSDSVADANQNVRQRVQWTTDEQGIVRFLNPSITDIRNVINFATSVQSEVDYAVSFWEHAREHSAFFRDGEYHECHMSSLEAFRTSQSNSLEIIKKEHEKRCLELQERIQAQINQHKLDLDAKSLVDSLGVQQILNFLSLSDGQLQTALHTTVLAQQTAVSMNEQQRVEAIAAVPMTAFELNQLSALLSSIESGDSCAVMSATGELKALQERLMTIKTDCSEVKQQVTEQIEESRKKTAAPNN